MRLTKLLQRKEQLLGNAALDNLFGAIHLMQPHCWLLFELLYLPVNWALKLETKKALNARKGCSDKVTLLKLATLLRLSHNSHFANLIWCASTLMPSIGLEFFGTLPLNCLFELDLNNTFITWYFREKYKERKRDRDREIHGIYLNMEEGCCSLLPNYDHLLG